VDAKRPDAERTCEVLSFFLRNPQISDSVEGIARWRLLDEAIFRGIRETEAILDELVGLGYLEEVTAVGVPRMFRLRPGAAEQAAAYMRQRGGPDVS
jgi:hypothetical protein